MAERPYETDQRQEVPRCPPGSTFETDIARLARPTPPVVSGCNPPGNNRYRPKDAVTRMQMVSFMARGAALIGWRGTEPEQRLVAGTRGKAGVIVAETIPDAFGAGPPRLRVLVVTSVHTPWDARILHRQIRAMLGAGWGVTFVAPWSAEDTAPSGVVAVTIPRAVGRQRLRAAAAARREVRRLAPRHDLVLVHDPELVPVVLSVRTRTPVIWDVHEDTAAALADRAWVPAPLRTASAALVRLVERLAERQCSLLLAEASYQSRFTRPHPVVLNLPWSRPQRSARTQPPRVVHVGRLSTSRGLVSMIEVGRALGDRAEVVLIGAVDAPDRARLEAAIHASNVRWLGFLPNAQAMEEIQGAVAGLALLRNEPNFRGSVPTKVLEYMSHGIPVVTTPLPEAERLVVTYEAGAVVPFDDFAETTEQVLDLINDEDLWEQRSAAGFAAVRDELSWDRAAPGFLAALRDVAAR